MPWAVVIWLTPKEAGSAPVSVGRAVHAWFLSRLEQSNPGLSQRLHDEEGLRPFTVSNLWGAGAARETRAPLDPARPCWIRLTALSDELEEALARALPQPGEPVRLADATFAVSGVAAQEGEHPWAGRAAYSDLVQRYTLSAGPSPRAVTLDFASPTVFRMQGQDLPLPLPSLVFGSYLQKWNSFAPLTLPEEAARYARECITLSRFTLRSHLVSYEAGDRGASVGYRGEVRFRFRVTDGYWTRLMALLGAYAFYCGTGHRTTQGMGQTRLLPEER